MENLESRRPRRRVSYSHRAKSGKAPSILSDVWDRYVRGVKPVSEGDIKKTVGLIHRYEAIRHFGQYVLCLLPRDEVFEAARSSSPSQRLTLQDARNELRELLPETFYSPVNDARVQGIRHQGDRLGLEVTYPGLEEEVNAWKLGLNKILGIEHEWSENPPIVNMTRRVHPQGVSNIEQLMDTAPETINLYPIPRLPK